MPIPRDITCWYCLNAQHGRCFSESLCACRVCGWSERDETSIPSARFEINKDDGPIHRARPYYIVEQGVRLPMMFSTFRGAERQVQMLALAPLSRAEVLDAVKGVRA